MKRKNFNFVQYLDDNRKKIIMNLIIFIYIIGILLIIDLVTKQTLFEWSENNLGKNQYDNNFRTQNWLFGIRSVSNSGLTSFGNNMPLGLVHFFNFVILIVCIFFVIILKSKWFVVSLAFIFAGTLGNMIDRFAFEGYVRDIIYLPWFDRGTFNFADVDAVVGTIMASVTLIVQLIMNWNQD